jgi:hypothetical protein
VSSINVTIRSSACRSQKLHILPFETGLTVKGDLLFSFGKESSWYNEENFYATLLPLTETGSSDAIHYLGGSVKIGYLFSRTVDPAVWRFRLAGGIYYTTTWVTQNAFGFRNLIGPELVPSIARNIGIQGNNTAADLA